MTHKKKEKSFISFIACPKCERNISQIKSTGKGVKDWCYYCFWCKDQIAPESVIKKMSEIKIMR